MTPQSDHLINLIFMKLKNYKKREFFLEEDNFKKFIYSLFEEGKT